MHALLPCLKLPTGGEWEDTRTRSELLQLKLATIDDPVHGDGKGPKKAAEGATVEEVEEVEETNIKELVSDDEEVPDLVDQK